MTAEPPAGFDVRCTSLSDAIPKVLRLVASHGQVAMVRDEPNLEVLCVDLHIADPTDRLPIVRGRRTITAFCLVEFLWYCAQRTDVASLEPYAPRIASFYGGDRFVTGSDYGRQMFARAAGASQWDRVRECLRRDPGSKRAYIGIFTADEMTTLLPQNHDVPCTIGFQVLIRGERLHWITTMRANDAYRGFVSDAFTFTLFQELLADTLDLPVGWYMHRVGSLHSFPEDEPSIQAILASTAVPTRQRMPAISATSFWAHLPIFWAAHDACRESGDWRGLRSGQFADDPWWSWAVRQIRAYLSSRAGT